MSNQVDISRLVEDCIKSLEAHPDQPRFILEAHFRSLKEAVLREAEYKKYAEWAEPNVEYPHEKEEEVWIRFKEAGDILQKLRKKM